MATARASWILIAVALLASWCAGLFARGDWTPDEPREADISWRMSWQADAAVPLLAGEAFCEKPPLNYWLAGASIRALGDSPSAARLPNLLYAIITTLSVGWLARRLAGARAAAAAGAACATFLLSYQVGIWLATDAPLLAAVALALAGMVAGFQATSPRSRLLGYTVMHLALGLGFLAKSAAVWVVPVLAFATLVIWERRWRELLRWELWIGLPLQALLIGAWVLSVYAGPEGPAHLRVFFWNNLVGRFAAVDAPSALQYTSGHRNTPGKYLLEMPVYLFPWTLLVIAAAIRAWRARAGIASDQASVLRWAIAIILPALLVLSVAATARNIYVAPLLPGVALLLGWWAREAIATPARADAFAIRLTAAILLVATLLAVAFVALCALDAGDAPGAPGTLIVSLVTGISAIASALLSLCAWRAAGRRQVEAALLALLLAYGALLAGTASQAYRYADRWQDLRATGRELKSDLATSPLLLIAPDETTRAWVDEYVSTEVARTSVPVDEHDLQQLTAWLADGGGRRALVQLEGRALSPLLARLAARLGNSHMVRVRAPPAWIDAAHLRIVREYAQPNGRRYALLAPAT